METKVKLTGNARWKQRLRAMPDNVRIEASRAAAKNAEVFAAAARKEAPELTGELKVSIKHYPVREFRGAVWRVVAGISGGRGFYARFVEFGTKNNRAEPFFFPIYRAFRPRFRARMGRALKKGQKKT